MTQPRSTLTWIGGPFPVPVPPDLALHHVELHSVVSGGSFRCPCGEHHDVPPPSEVAVRVRALDGEADLWTSTRGGGARRPDARIRGVVGEAATHALARHALSLLFGGVICEDAEETLAALTETAELDFLFFSGELAETRVPLLERLRRSGVPGDARLCFVGRDVLLREVHDVATEVTPFVQGALLFQMVPHPDVKEVSLLAAAAAPALVMRGPRKTIATAEQSSLPRRR